MKTTLAALLTGLLHAGTIEAHPGHAAPEVHLHAHDALLTLALAVALVAIGAWLRRK